MAMHTIEGEAPARLRAGADLTAVFESLSEGILVVDSDLRILLVNRAAEAILEVRRTDVLGRKFTDAFGGQVSEPVRRVHDGTVRGDGVRDFELRFRTRRGDARTLLVNTTRLPDPDGIAPGIVAVFRDVSEVRALTEALRGRFRFHSLMGKSAAMQRVFHLVEQVAKSDATVVIRGESGTGKELVARAVHYESARSAGPFVPVSCAALPESLLEAELFGHAKGAFTGAAYDRIGRFEAASGGTLLLDEISDLSPTTQVKLLRVLQEREVERIGESRPRRVDVRVLCATRRDLAELVRGGRLRDDLFYRLNVVTVELPPLRERKDDIPLLVNHFVDQFNRRMGKFLLGPTESAMARLLDHGWPGNVRELEHAVEHAFVRCEGPRFSADDLPADLRRAPTRPPEGSGRRNASWRSAKPSPERERALILRALEETGGNQAKAARLLGMGRVTLWRKLRQFGIREPSAARADAVAPSR